MSGRIRTAGGEVFQSLRYRNFRLFFTGQLISQVGNWLTMVGQTLLVLHLTDNGLAVGLLAACQFGPVLLIGAWAGLVADRSDKRKLLIIVQAFAMLQSFLLAALAFMDSPPLLAIYGLAIAGGFATAFDNPARRAFVVEMVPEERVQNAISLNSALMTSARIVGPALAGLLVSTVGYGWCFAADGISYLAVIAGLWMMHPSELRAATPAVRAKGQVRAGIRYARSVPDVWVPLTMMAIVGALAFNFTVVMPLFVTRSLHGTDTTFTLVYSVISIGSVIGALATARRTTIEIPHVVTGAAFFGVAMLLFAASPNLAVAFPVAMLVGLASIVFVTASTAIVQIRAAPEMRGRVLALQSLVFLGTTPIGGPLIGLVCDTAGPRVGFVVGGAACLGAAAWGRAADGRIRAGRSEHSREPADAFSAGHRAGGTPPVRAA